MNEKELFREEQGPVERLEYEDGTVVLAADVGAGSEATVDIVGDTVIVVTGEDQYEFAVPAGDARAFIKNGVLTVEVDA